MKGYPTGHETLPHNHPDRALSFDLERGRLLRSDKLGSTKMTRTDDVEELTWDEWPDSQPATHYALNDLSYGACIIAPNGRNIAFFQGDDYDAIMREEEEVCRIWSRRFGKGYRKSYGPFKSYEEHMDAVLSEYDY